MIKILTALSLLLITTAVFAQSDKPPQAFLDGVEAEQSSDYKTAAALFRQAIAERPTLIFAHYRLGRLLVRQELNSEAIDAFNELLNVDPENLLAHYEIGKLHLATRNYTDAIAKYRWLKSQTEKPTDGSSDQIYDLLPSKPRTGNLAQNPAHRAYAGELAQYLLDMIPPDIAEQNQLPASQIVFVAPRGTSSDPNRQQQVAPVTNQPAEPSDPTRKQQAASFNKKSVEPMTANLRPKILYQEKAKYTEIARINRIQGSVMLSLVFDAAGELNGIRVVRGLPDGLTQCAIRAAQKIRFEPATRDGAPVSVRGTLEFSFNLY